MKIALMSFEYPPDTPYGGIATYFYQAARMLHKRGHHVEVFAGSPYRSATEVEEGIVVHRVNEKTQEDAYEPMGRTFAKRHDIMQFDVLEGPELEASAQEAIRFVPDIPLVVKLHSPSLLLWKNNNRQFPEPPFPEKLLLHILARLRGHKPSWKIRHETIEAERLEESKLDAIERAHVLEADEITAPSQAIREKMVEEWNLDPTMIVHVPNPFISSEKLLRIPIETRTNTVTYVGSLEIRKGAIDLAQAIPIVLRRHPETKFRFVGPNWYAPTLGTEIRQYLELFLLRHYRRSVEFTGAVSSDRISDILRATDICIFPSHWENFPYVCLEAMTAGRGIVCGNSGGMPEMLDYGRVGLLIHPGNHGRIAEAIIELLEHPELRMRLGMEARNRVLKEYNADRVGALQEASYYRAIERRRGKGARQTITNSKQTMDMPQVVDSAVGPEGIGSP